MKKITLLSSFIFLSFFPSNSMDLNDVSKDIVNKNNIGFIENKGQILDQNGNIRKDILFATNHKGIKVFLKNNGFTYEVYKTEESAGNHKNGSNWDDLNEKIKNTKTYYHRIDIELLGCNNNSLIIPEEKSENYFNYYGNQSQQQHINHYKKITYKEIYPKIDFVFYINDSGVKYDFVVHPGGNPDVIKLKYDGMNDITINPTGNLVLATSIGNINENIPECYTVSKSDNGKKKVKVLFKRKANIINFEAEKYNSKNTLIIDPIILWSTYYGGLDKEECYGITKYNDNNIIVSGYTNSITNIATTGSFQGVYGGGFFDAFVIKFNKAGVRQWATYYGGAGANIGTDVATDHQGNIILIGYTEVSNGITTNGVHQFNYGGGTYDAFIVKFDSLGARLWGTYYGGADLDIGTTIAADSVSNIVIAGYTASTSAISTSGSYQSAFGGGSSDAFIAKFNPNGVRQWATYYGGNDVEEALGVAVDSAMSNIAVTGFTKSASAIAISGAHQQTFGGNEDAFVAVFNNSGNINWATYYGGTDVDRGQDVDVSKCGHVAITGYTKSLTGISTTGVHQEALSGMEDAFIARFDPAGIRIWGTYFGGNNIDKGFGIQLSPSSHYVAITGYTKSAAGISTSGVYQPVIGGGEDAFIADFNPSGVLRNATYLGGASNDRGFGIAGNNAFYISGYTESTSAIATSGGFQTTFGGGTYDGFVAQSVVKPRRVVAGGCPGSGGGGGGPAVGCGFICVNLDGPLYDDEASTNAYNWNLPGGSPSTSTDQSPQNICYGGAGSYSGTIDVSNAAGSDPTINLPVIVVINPLPIIIAGNDSTICLGNSVPLNASGGIIYSWSPTDGLDNPTISNPIATPTATTVYTVTGFDIDGCSSTDFVTITIPPDVDAGPDLSFCVGQSIQLNAVNAATYTWTPPGDLSDPNISNPVATPANNTIYYVAGINSIGCQSSDTILVTVNPLPVIDAGPDVTICDGTNIQLNAVGGLTYLWTPSSGLDNDTIANPLATVSSITSYQVTGTDINGCQNTDTVTINVFATTGVDAGSDTIICTGGTIQLNAISGGQAYLWSPATGLSDSAIANPVATVFDPTTYIVTITDVNGCNSSDSITINVLSLPNIIAGPDTTVCRGVSLQLNASGGLSYSWTPATGLDNPSISNPVATVLTTTNYLVNATDVNGCVNRDSVLVTIYSDSVLNGDFSSIINYCKLEIKFISNFSNGETFLWDFGDGSASTEPNPVHTYPGFGNTYTVTLIVHSSSGCYDTLNSTDTISHDIRLYKEDFINSLILPNVFTPNNDGLNDNFIIGGIECLPYYFVIYNRWGNKIFETDETNHIWDGTVRKNGKLASEGVYYYLLRFGYYSDTDPTTEIAGFVHLIR